jgi:hypothetical protein
MANNAEARFFFGIALKGKRQHDETIDAVEWQSKMR